VCRICAAEYPEIYEDSRKKQKNPEKEAIKRRRSRRKLTEESLTFMPVFGSGKGLAPDWCELEYFEIVELPVGSRHEFARVGKKENLIVVKRTCLIAFCGGQIDASEGTNLRVPGVVRFDISPYVRALG
jgi:hypothetical protein